MVFNHTHSGHRSQLGIGFKSNEHLIVCLKLRNIKTKCLKVIWRAFIHSPLLTYGLTDFRFFSENHKQTRAEVSEADPTPYHADPSKGSQHSLMDKAEGVDMRQRCTFSQKCFIAFIKCNKLFPSQIVQNFKTNQQIFKF